MQLTDQNKRHPLVFLSQLPKERIVLDYVLSKLVKNSSPERYELIAAVFNLHLTSAGFDPMALSKARFKRVKASEFRQALREIDAEIALILQTEEYRQVLSRQTYLPELFQQYLQLSAAVRQSGTINTRQFHDFANLLREKDASDLMLGFIRQHKNLFEASLSEEDINDLLQQFDLLIRDQENANTFVRCLFELRMNEMLCMRGVRNPQDINRIWQFFRDRLALEKENIQSEMLEKVLRAGSLTAWPARNLQELMPLFASRSESYYFNQHQQRILLFLKLGELFTEAGVVQRLQWLDEAEEIARIMNSGKFRAGVKMIRARIVFDQGGVDEAGRLLDEAEYHIHRVQDKDFELRNTWVEIIRTRMVFYSLSVLENRLPLHPASFEAQLFLLNDIGRHRSDVKMLVSELNGLTLFLQKNWPAAQDAFMMASEQRGAEEELQPMHYINLYFRDLLGNGSDVTGILETVEDQQEPFYSYSWVRLMRLATDYYRFADGRSRDS